LKVARLNGGAYSSSKVSGITPLQPRPTQYRATIYPTAVVDAAGNMYVAWADGRNAGRGNDILISKLAAGSRAWSAPTVLNTDATAADQLMPALSVDANGTVTAIWLDNRNDPANVNYDVYMSVARNGVFGANQRVTSVSSNPYNDPRMQGTMIGDYFAVASGNGVAYAVWCDTRNNNEDIFLAPVPTQ
jgi:hypothetical protein